MPSVVNDLPKCLIVGKHRIAGKFWADASRCFRAVTDHAARPKQCFASLAVSC